MIKLVLTPNERTAVPHPLQHAQRSRRHLRTLQKTVATAPHGFDIRRGVSPIFQRPANLANAHPEDRVRDMGIRPEILQQLFFRHQLERALGKIAQHSKGSRPQRDVPIASP